MYDRYQRNYRRPRGPKYSLRKLIFWPLTGFLFIVLIGLIIYGYSNQSYEGLYGWVFTTFLLIIISAIIATYNN